MPPVHDYVISNASGSAVRADLNNALAAIVSNNSNASSPSTTYAYQWWADTTTGQLKLRNSANNAWITIFELDGTMLMEDGSAASPGLAFASDLNTGIFRPGADQLNISTNGAERLSIGNSEFVVNDASNDVDFRVESNGNTHMLFVDGENDRVTIGTSTAATNADITIGATAPQLSLFATPGNISRVTLGDTDDWNIGQLGYDNSDNSMFFTTNNAEALRIDNSGRLLVGHSADIGNQSLQVVTSNGATAGLFKYGNNDDGSELTFFTSRNASKGSHTVVQNGDYLGRIFFRGSDGSGFERGAEIAVRVDGTPGTNDMPGRIEFYTTPDGSTTPSERLKIDSSGNLGIGGNGTGNGLGVFLRRSSPTTSNFYEASDGTKTMITGVDSSNDFVKIGSLSNHPVGFVTNNSERLRIDSSGKVAIGSTSPEFKFMVADAGYSAIEIKSDRTGATENIGGLHFKTASTSVAYIQSLVDGTLKFRNTSSLTERMRIDSSGRLLVGRTGTITSNSVQACHVVEQTTDFNWGFGVHCAQSNKVGITIYYANTTNNHDAFRFMVASSTKAVIEGNGNISNANNSYGQVSDITLKENIVDANSQWDDIKNIRVRNFNFKESTGNHGKTMIGVVAQELETVSPGLVYTNDDGYKEVGYSILYMKAIKALQEAIAKIETLETKVAALEAG